MKITKKVVLYLREELEKRKKINTNYSLRSFARNLTISPSILSEIINEKKDLSPKILRQIAPHLNIDKDKLESFLAEQTFLKKSKNIKSTGMSGMHRIDMETFSVISDWYHYAILELFSLDHYDMKPEWISSKLNITLETAINALKRLEQVKLLEKNKNGELRPSNNFKALEDYCFTSIAMRERQRQVLKLSAEKIDQDGLNHRDHSSITLSVDLDLIPEVKERIKAFRRSLGNFIAKNNKKAEAVYEMQISFIPVTNFEVK